VKVLDFGVARIEQDARITGQNMIVGTPEYIAPEQIRSHLPTPSSDLYSLGCVLFEMLTGRIPFEGKTTALLVKHINEPPVPPSRHNPAIPPEVDRIVLKLLQKKPEQRHRDAYHLVEDVQRLLDALPGVASSRPNNLVLTPATPLPSSDFRLEEEDWARTARLYRQLMLEAHPHGAWPPWMGDAVAEIERGVDAVRDLRAELERAAAGATEHQEGGREPRRQIGHALDELSQDDSRLGRQIGEVIEQLEPAESRLDAAVHAVLSGASGTPAELKTGDVVDGQDERALRELVRACRELALGRELVSELRARLTRKQAERRDLRFQIAALKQKLDQLNQASTVDMAVWHEETHRLSCEIQTKLESIAPVARRIASDLQRYPELRDRLPLEPALLC
jgi:serine/threonine-protein kinase